MSPKTPSDAGDVGDDSPGLQPGLSAGAALYRLLDRFAEDYGSALARLHDSDDPAGPHQTRVALRRLRSLLWAFAPILRRSRRKRWSDRSRDLFLAIGPLRDADVLAARPRAPEDAAARAERLRDETRERLRRMKAGDFARRLVSAARGGSWFRRGKTARRLRRGPVSALARGALDRAWARCLAHGGNLAALPEAEAHALRKDVKRVRYIAEDMAPLWPGAAAEAWIGRIKALQDQLGALTDLFLAAREQHGPPPAPPYDCVPGLTAAWRRLAMTPPYWVLT